MPFGAATQKYRASVGHAGQVLLSAGKGTTYTIKWGSKAAQHCENNLDINSTPATDGYQVMDAVRGGQHL